LRESETRERREEKREKERERERERQRERERERERETRRVPQNGAKVQQPAAKLHEHVHPNTAFSSSP
jgi:hypothetical protein